MRRRPPRSALFPYTTLFRASPRSPGRGSPVPTHPPSGALDHMTSTQVRPNSTPQVAVNDIGTEEDFLAAIDQDRKSTRLNSSHANISYAVFCLKKKKRPRSLCSPTTAQASSSKTFSKSVRLHQFPSLLLRQHALSVMAPTSFVTSNFLMPLTQA